MLKQIYLTLFLLSAFSMNSTGQDLNFDKTVDYLNEKLIFFATNIASISATKQGDVDVYFDLSGANYRFNLFEVQFLNGKNKRGIPLLQIKCIKKGCELVKLSRSGIYTNIRLHDEIKIDITRANQVPKIIKALNHLKKLCDPDSDPF